MLQDFTIYPLGNGAVTLSFGNKMEEKTAQKVLQLFRYLKDGNFPFLDVVPAYSSLTVYYDATRMHPAGETAFEQVKRLLTTLAGQELSLPQNNGKTVRIPVCYDSPFGPDLEEVALRKNLTVDKVIQLHTAPTYRVYMIGFLPGFPYLGGVDERIALPRKSNPRTHIPAGSVGIAGVQTGIYPLASPGGWNLIGRTPMLLFDKNNQEPVRLQPGDFVTFYSITTDEFENYQERIA